MSTEVTTHPNNEGCPFQKLPNDVFSTILTYAINGDLASSLCSFQFVNTHWNTFIESPESSKAWKFVCKQKFSGLFQFNACTREDYISLLRDTQPSAWIIQRAMCRLTVAKIFLNFFTHWTRQDVIKITDPCCICGVRWNENSFDRCEVDSCPFRRFLHCGARHGHYQRKELEWHSRLYVCEPCGKKQPQMAMGKCPRGVEGMDTACFHCAQIKKVGKKRKISEVMERALVALESDDDS